MATAGRILIMPKGAYDESTTYEMLDLVKHNGTSWLAKKTVIGIEPSEANSEYWHKMFDLPDVITAINEHKADTTAHVTSAEREMWDAKVNSDGTVAHVSIAEELPASPDAKTLYFVKHSGIYLGSDKIV